MVIKFIVEAETMFDSYSFVSKGENSAQKANKLQAAGCLALGHIGFKNETIASIHCSLLSLMTRNFIESAHK